MPWGVAFPDGFADGFRRSGLRNGFCGWGCRPSGYWLPGAADILDSIKINYISI